MSRSVFAIIRPLRCHHSNVRTPATSFLPRNAAFHTSAARRVVKPFLLADIGEGITEVQVIQWFVQEGAKVAQFDKICEVQSDKASVDITSRFDGTVTKLHYKADDVAKVGQPLVDIDMEGEEAPQAAKAVTAPDVAAESPRAMENSEPVVKPPETSLNNSNISPNRSAISGRHDTLATPAVRHLSKELKIDIVDVTGTGKDGRVTKDDLQQFARDRAGHPSRESKSRSNATTGDKTIPITGIKGQMFKAMTRSLSIPHFLYTSPIDLSSLSAMRLRIQQRSNQKFSPLPFIIKAVSLTLQQFSELNAHLDLSDAAKPLLIHKASHNFAIAIDSPHGLVVPVIHNVQDLSISEILVRVRELAGRARDNKLSPHDLSGATFTISNIGSIGGGVVAPVISSPQVAILGVGRARTVAVWDDEENRPVRKEECIFSWSADHRVVDGAAVARAGERVKELLEEVGHMVLDLR